jgi:Protein of unknown function (DUF2975)
MKKESRAASLAYVLVNAMLFLLVAGVVVGAIALVHALVRGGSVPVHAELERVHIRSLPGLRIVAGPDATIEIRDATAKQQLLSAATAVGPAFLLGMALWLLRGLAGSVREGTPFGLANVRRLRSLGSLLVAGGLVVAFVDWALRLSLANTLPPSAFGGVGFDGFRFPFPLLLAGLGAFILAEVFAHGVALREDVEATI